MNETIYIKDELQDTFRRIGVGLVKSINIYRVEGDRCFFTAGRGKFHMTKSEIREAQVPNPKSQVL
jgi:hypothetical protein